MFKGETMTFHLEFEGMELSLQLAVEKIQIVEGHPSVDISYDHHWWRGEKNARISREGH